ncbi:cytochrome P450 [Xylariaceae sp. FL0804]|nr:cytochrome P450 [Xylariaceae sp. FL0804]
MPLLLGLLSIPDGLLPAGGPAGGIFAAGGVPLLLLFLVIYLGCIPGASSPLLDALPGPRAARFTSLVLRWHEMRGRRTRYVHDLHLKYGSAVRLAPREVAFASAAAVREIYGAGGSGYDKTEFYDLFQVYGRRYLHMTPSSLTSHAARRRVLADRYANSNIMKPASLDGLKERSARFVARCAEAGDAAVDIFVRLHDYAFDGATHHLFHPYGSDSLRNPDDEEVMKQVAFDDSLQNRLLQYYSPALHRVVGGALSLLGIAKPRQTPLADALVLSAAATTDPAPFTLLSRMLQQGEQQQEQAQGEQQNDDDDRDTSNKSKSKSRHHHHAMMDRVDMAAECLDHMAAGIDTTGDALCFLMWELSQPRSRRAQRRLQAELLQQQQHHAADDGGGGGGGVDDGGFNGLPYLDAVVLEGLRCFPPIPMSLPRYAPTGRRRAGVGAGADSDVVVIDGHAVPAGTVVSCQAYSTHRLDAAVFPRPDRFEPERWLVARDGDGDEEEEAEAARQRHRLFFAFASGGRGCIGKHLALAEMKTLLRDVYSRFTTLPDGTTTDEDMEMADQLISSQPRGKKCLLRFVPLDPGEV